MSDIDDLDDTGNGGAIDAAASAAEAITGAPAAVCLSCGAAIAGTFCVACGQKHDDMRRSVFLLARDFIEDTFAFDSRMWRTLGLLAVSPGVVPNSFSHGRRSHYTPPVRLFLVVSFLFFLTLSLTKTLFVAIQVTPVNETPAAYLSLTSTEETPAEGVEPSSCGLTLSLRFLTRADDIPEPPANWVECRDQISDEAEQATTDDAPTNSFDIFAARALAGIGAAINDPAGFNASFNNWLPRLMFLMTPIAALILSMFIRGRDALYFDHLVLAVYTHAIGFAVVAIVVLLTPIAAPYVGIAATLFLFFYLVGSIKRAYGRGWVKTVWTAFMSGLLYLLILFSALMAITTSVLLNTAS